MYSLCDMLSQRAMFKGYPYGVKLRVILLIAQNNQIS